MTNAEKQEIIDAVLAALATNSKTIAQLSPKQSLEDSDLFEVAGGSRVTYLVLKNGIREGLALASQLSDYVTGDQAMMYLAKLDTETGTIDYMESPCVMLDGFKDVNGYSPATGDLFYENRSGYQIWTKTQGGATGEHANTHVAYINRNENAIYRWTGTTMERIGGCAVVNDLTTGGGDKALSAEMGKRLKSNIDAVQANIVKLYAKLGDIAFWSAQDKEDAEPTTLDWGNPKHIVTLSLNLTHAVVKYNGVAKNNGDTIPNVEEGSTIQLTVEAESGYELDTISSQAGTVNGSTVSLVMGTANATLDITASASSAYTISYDLTNCAAPTGVTNPATIKSGETKTIYLEAGNNFTMPASLPVGAVSGATASYTRDALDDTKATLVLSNATGNVTVDIDGVEVPPELHLVLQAFIDTGNSHYFIQGGSYNNNAKKRAMVVVKRSETSNPCTWGSTDGVSEDPALEAEYSAIPIPSGATQVTMKCNSTYYYIVGLLNSSGVPQNADNTWTIGSTQKSWTLADYPNATHIQLIFKIGSGGTTQFSNQTWETIGIDFNIE